MKKRIDKKRKNSQSLIDKIKQIEEEKRLEDIDKLNIISKTTLNKRLVFVMVFFVALFMTLALYLVYFQLFKRSDIENDSHNRRLWVNEDNIKRGSIYDRNGNVLAYSEEDSDGSQYRIYNYGKSASSVTGYSSKTYGKTGIEKSYNKELLALSGENLSNFRKMVVKNDTGYDVHLSLDQNIQEIVYEHIKDIKGSCVVMNPKTGEVLALVSNPSYDPNSVDEDWDFLIQNTDGPLVNRATSGAYRPGSTFKIVTATGVLNYDIDTSYNDTGVENIQGYDIKNFADQAFGMVNLRSAFVNSINTYFASKTNDLGRDKYKELAEKFMINKDYEFDMDKNNAIIPFNDLNQVDLAMTGFGYGKTQISPLHMAMITSAIANEGKMMQPRLVTKVIDKDGKIIEEKKDKVLSEVTSVENANYIRDMMVSVVNEGTGTSAYLDSVQIAGKTGTADKENNLLDAWFVGFAPAYDPDLAIALVVEDSDDTGGVVAAPIARDIISEIYQTIE
ncbi:Penicillin-binding protein A [Anaerococcus prevotii]|uniref:Peptidoglycan glycosyltransferase n=1 Tax=Anaerococcus prevotii (strain ATCC 9321 / DSM 20548 / JCM 6508 / NCTC 11806 / PC1) TaxID=525919 RepID=C7RHE3_ANAPD|nr:penicillin-binding protein 2 [Anaerococcus prevotii]ACV28904.1 Peptidoglycan glycosyltransferase [Anaerococcus prevotii DSM 20548]SUU94577.1 Penicillin-binding protein A [Anaerococcus prevotii]